MIPRIAFALVVVLWASFAQACPLLAARTRVTVVHRYAPAVAYVAPAPAAAIVVQSGPTAAQRRHARKAAEHAQRAAYHASRS